MTFKSQEEGPQGGIDNLMGWLSLYLPSWGTSLILHAAIVILMFFMAWQVQAQQPPAFEYRSAVVAQRNTRVEPRDVPPPTHANPNAQAGGYGKGRPGPSTILHQYTGSPIPDVADGRTGVRLNVLGTGVGGNGRGGFEGLGPSGRNSGFFSVGALDEGKKIVYIVDRSGSMADTLDYVKYELRRSIRELGEQNQFYVIFFSSGPPVMMPTGRLVPATDKNKQMAREFIDDVVAVGVTDPSQAIHKALAMGADLVYLLTDGEFDKSIAPLIKGLNVGGKVTVHTICFFYHDPNPEVGEAILKRIAHENGGEYKFISETDLAELSN